MQWPGFAAPAPKTHNAKTPCRAPWNWCESCAMKTDQSAPIPDEHRDGLEHRLARVERGEEAFIDWSDVREALSKPEPEEVLAWERRNPASIG